MIRDPLGRMLGFDTESRLAFSEIFNSSYVHSSIGTLEGEAGSQLESLQVGIGAPENADGVKIGDGDGVAGRTVQRNADRHRHRGRTPFTSQAPTIREDVAESHPRHRHARGRTRSSTSFAAPYPEVR
jgi:hypothetical protein